MRLSLFYVVDLQNILVNLKPNYNNCIKNDLNYLCRVINMLSFTTSRIGVENVIIFMEKITFPTCYDFNDSLLLPLYEYRIKAWLCPTKLWRE